MLHKNTSHFLRQQEIPVTTILHAMIAYFSSSCNQQVTSSSIFQQSASIALIPTIFSYRDNLQPYLRIIYIYYSDFLQALEKNISACCKIGARGGSNIPKTVNKLPKRVEFVCFTYIIGSTTVHCATSLIHTHFCFAYGSLTLCISDFSCSSVENYSIPRATNSKCIVILWQPTLVSTQL